MKVNDLRERTDEELQQLLVDRYDDLMHFRLQMATGVVENVRSAREARRTIARIRTVINERARAAQPAAQGEND